MKYAIVESGGKQYKAVEGGTLEVDRLPVEPGASVKLEQILLLADGENVTVGTPVVKGNPVWAKVVGHFKGKKVVVFKYSPKKRIRVKAGHRQNYTRLLVEQIGGATLTKRDQEPSKAEKVVEAEVVAPEKKATKAAPKAKKPPETAKAAAPKAKAAPAKTEKPAPAKKPAAKAQAKPAAKPAAKSTSSSKGTKPAAAPAKKTTAKPAPKKVTPKAPAKKTSATKGAASPKGTSSPKGKKPAAK